MRIDVYLHDDNDKHAEIVELLHQILQKENHMSVEMDALKAQVDSTASVEASAIALIQGIAAQIAAAGVDPVALQALQTELATSSAALADAVAANTPAVVPAP